MGYFVVILNFMKIIQIVGEKELKIVDESSERKLETNQVAVLVKRVSLCGSDIKLYKGNYGGPCNYPLTFGHEWAGEVLEVAEDVVEFSAGDHVTGDCSCWCGACINCKDDKNLCENIEKFGITIDGFSKQVAIVDKKYLYRSDSNLDFKILALTECFAVALHAIKKTIKDKMDVNTKVLINGSGAIGIATYLLLCYKFKIKNISIYDKEPKKVGVLSNIINKDIANLDMTCIKENQTYAEMYDDNGFDYIFETSGTVSGLESAIELANSFGKITYIGISDGTITNTKMLTTKALTLKGSIGGTGEFEDIIEFFEQNREMVEKVVTFESDVDSVQEVFENMIHNPENIKCQIIFL